MGAVLLQSSYGSRKTWKASNSVLVKEISDVKARTKQDRDTNGAHYFLCTELNLAEICWFVL